MSHLAHTHTARPNPWLALKPCLDHIRERTSFQPQVGLILGSGLGHYASKIQVECVIPYRDLPGFPVSTVAGHAGQFIFGYVGQTPIVAMQGRVHFYEGYSMSEVVLPTRLMALLGVCVLFLSNAAGGVNERFGVGDLMLIKDQIASFVPSPLIGPNPDAMGLRFPDMSEIYDQELSALIQAAAQDLNIPLQEGQYLQFTGPNFESPAEIRMARTLGADAVGMSTACEALAARHLGLRVVGISLISNAAAGLSESPLTHEEVQEAADLAAPRFESLVTESIQRFASVLPAVQAARQARLEEQLRYIAQLSQEA